MKSISFSSFRNKVVNWIKSNLINSSFVIRFLYLNAKLINELKNLKGGNIFDIKVFLSCFVISFLFLFFDLLLIFKN